MLNRNNRETMQMKMLYLDLLLTSSAVINVGMRNRIYLLILF